MAKEAAEKSEKTAQKFEKMARKEATKSVKLKRKSQGALKE